MASGQTYQADNRMSSHGNPMQLQFKLKPHTKISNNQIQNFNKLKMSMDFVF